MRPPPLHNTPHPAAPTERRIALHDTFRVFGPRQVPCFALEQPGYFLLDCGGREGVEVWVRVFEGEGVGIGEVGEESVVEFWREGEEG